MIHVLDIHAVVWHLEGSPRLPRAAAEILSDPASRLVVPAMVLAEMSHLYHQQRIRTDPAEVRRRIQSADNCIVYPLDEAVLNLLPAGLDLHTAVLAATAILYRDVLAQPVRVVTPSSALAQRNLVETVW